MVTWGHTSYLISVALIRQHQLRHPAIRRGEASVSVAKVLLRPRSVSLIDGRVYWYRKYPKSWGLERSTYRDVVGTLKHAKPFSDFGDAIPAFNDLLHGFVFKIWCITLMTHTLPRMPLV